MTNGNDYIEIIQGNRSASNGGGFMQNLHKTFLGQFAFLEDITDMSCNH